MDHNGWEANIEVDIAGAAESQEAESMTRAAGKGTAEQKKKNSRTRKSGDRKTTRKRSDRPAAPSQPRQGARNQKSLQNSGKPQKTQAPPAVDEKRLDAKGQRSQSNGTEKHPAAPESEVKPQQAEPPAAVQVAENREQAAKQNELEEGATTERETLGVDRATDEAGKSAQQDDKNSPLQGQENVAGESLFSPGEEKGTNTGESTAEKEEAESKDDAANRTDSLSDTKNTAGSREDELETAEALADKNEIEEHSVLGDSGEAGIEETGQPLAANETIEGKRLADAVHKTVTHLLADKFATRVCEEWQAQAQDVKKEYERFNLAAECRGNPCFLTLLKAGIPVKQAYEVTNLSRIKADMEAESARRAIAYMMEKIRTVGMRPSENGIHAPNAMTIGSNIATLSKKEREEIARRARKGEKVTL